MELGDIVLVVDCFTNGRGDNEHAAIVTRVWSATEIDCVVFLASAVPNFAVEERLHHESVQARGKRFRLKGDAA